jgi:glyoxylase-like metal-dependent hydrolase (beta-lactamase superfamily II)
MLEDTFADIIGKARYGKGLSLPELSQRTDLAISRIEALEEGSAPDESEVRLLAPALGLDPGKLGAIARSEWLPAPIETNWPELIVRTIDGRIGTYPVNGYLLVDPVRKEAALFDTGYSPNRVIRLVQEEGIRLVALCITHAHPDHIGGADRIQTATGAPIYLHPNELPGGKKTPTEIVLLKEGMTIPVGRFQIRPLNTPGHTVGGTTFLIDPAPHAPYPLAFVGDTLFAGSTGRAHTPATYPVLLDSVQTRILSLSQETLLFPGHGPATRVIEEQNHNPFFSSPGRFDATGTIGAS